MTCPALDIENGGLASALHAVDCRTGESTSVAFGRLFGAHGTLLPALTGLLTLYVAIFAIGLLTGRTRLGVTSLTPRMMTMGLVLTFATSWLAYQNVIWTLTTGAPDQIASLIAGTHGSASAAFADKLDMIFSAIADSTKQTATSVVSATGATTNGATPGGGMFTPQGMLWLSGLMLLVGTVGVLVTAKVALAALLAVGPVFIVMALFAGTRGLFEGWLKAVVSFAMVPMFVVLIGGAALSMIAPLIQAALMDSTTTSTKAVTALFLGACVYSALMVIVVKVTTTIVAGWRLPFGTAPEPTVAPAMPAAAAAPAPLLATRANGQAADTVRSIVAALPAPDGGSAAAASTTTNVSRITRDIAAPLAAPAPSGSARLQGVGSRFRTSPAAPSRAQLK
ncbi:type IV secretion system protein [Sphingomonas abietis]|uniref:Type IV secretion system protein n=1 Tax=Sphingomonas abietis TaxID=3012344 RepID=A0ABY7NQG8_9SPHN|nr:type IV secretion system protein [Sphingomonas abietis]WBO23785.1 type IV secretion system protein [Sphingomonas abietis]